MQKKERGLKTSSRKFLIFLKENDFDFANGVYRAEQKNIKRLSVSFINLEICMAYVSIKSIYKKEGRFGGGEPPPHPGPGLRPSRSGNHRSLLTSSSSKKEEQRIVTDELNLSPEEGDQKKTETF